MKPDDHSLGVDGSKIGSGRRLNPTLFVVLGVAVIRDSIVGIDDVTHLCCQATVISIFESRSTSFRIKPDAGSPARATSGSKFGRVR